MGLLQFSWGLCVSDPARRQVQVRCRGPETADQTAARETRGQGSLTHLSSTSPSSMICLSCGFSLFYLSFHLFIILLPVLLLSHLPYLSSVMDLSLYCNCCPTCPSHLTLTCTFASPQFDWWSIVLLFLRVPTLLLRLSHLSFTWSFPACFFNLSHLSISGLLYLLLVPPVCFHFIFLSYLSFCCLTCTTLSLTVLYLSWQSSLSIMSDLSVLPVHHLSWGPPLHVLFLSHLSIRWPSPSSPVLVSPVTHLFLGFFFCPTCPTCPFLILLVISFSHLSFFCLRWDVHFHFLVPPIISLPVCLSLVHHLCSTCPFSDREPQVPPDRAGQVGISGSVLPAAAGCPQVGGRLGHTRSHWLTPD